MSKNLSFSKLFHKGVLSVNNSKFFAGLVMIMLNIGSKYITIKLSKRQEEYLNQFSLARQLLIFSIVWMGTKDIYVSLGMTAVFTILAEHLFNEESEYCVLPRSWAMMQEVMDSNKDGDVSDEEIDRAIDVLNRAKIQKRRENEMQFVREFMRNRI